MAKRIPQPRFLLLATIALVGAMIAVAFLLGRGESQAERQPANEALTVKEAFTLAQQAAVDAKMQRLVIHDILSTDAGDTAAGVAVRGDDGKRSGWNAILIEPLTNTWAVVEIRGGVVTRLVETSGSPLSASYAIANVGEIELDSDQLVAIAKGAGLLSGEDWATGYHIRVKRALSEGGALLAYITGVDAQSNVARIIIDPSNGEVLARWHKVPGPDELVWDLY